VGCSSFLCQVIVGTKTGSLCLYDISSSTLLSETQAHTGAIWSIQVRPDQRGLVSGSADKDVKFWDFEMKETDANAQIVKDRMGNERVVRRSCSCVAVCQ
jgi:U3 small nucleolar RNA-associated protein 12